MSKSFLVFTQGSTWVIIPHYRFLESIRANTLQTTQRSFFVRNKASISVSFILMCCVSREWLARASFCSSWFGNYPCSNARLEKKSGLFWVEEAFFIKFIILIRFESIKTILFTFTIYIFWMLISNWSLSWSCHRPSNWWKPRLLWQNIIFLKPANLYNEIIA